MQCGKLVSVFICAFLLAGSSYAQRTTLDPNSPRPPSTTQGKAGAYKAGSNSANGLVVKIAEKYPTKQPSVGYIALTLYNVSTPDGREPRGQILTLPFGSTDPQEYGIDNLRIYYYDSEVGMWSEVAGSAMDQDAFAMTAPIYHSGLYAISAVHVEDNIPPTVSWILPAGNNTIDGTKPVPFLCSVTDNVGVSMLRFKLVGDNGEEQSLGWKRSGMDNGWSMDVDLSHHMSGTYKLIAEANDSSANTSIAEQVIKLETKEPAVTLTIDKPSTADYNPANQELTVRGKISNPARKKVTLMLAPIGMGAVDDVQGTWEGKIFTFSLPPGETTVAACARDEYGNQFQVSTPLQLPILGVSISAKPEREQAAGGTVTLTCGAKSGIKPEYKLEMSTDETKWTLLRGYASSDTYDWQVPDKAGAYAVRVTGREAGTTGPEYSETMSYSVAGPLTGVELVFYPEGGANLGTAVNVHGFPVGGGQYQPLEYKIELHTDGDQWKVLSDYAPNGHYAWVPEAAGTYTLRVSARKPGTTTPVYTDKKTYKITEPANWVRVTLNPEPPQLKNTKITVQASSKGAAKPEYKFELNREGAKWTLLRDYSAEDSVIWIPDVENNWFAIRVSVRESGSVNPICETEKRCYITEPLQGVEVGCTSPSPQAKGTALTVMATPMRGAAVEYRFEVSTDGQNWTPLSAGYQTSNECRWTPAAAGNYTLRVVARQQGTTSPVYGDTVDFAITEGK